MFVNLVYERDIDLEGSNSMDKQTL